LPTSRNIWPHARKIGQLRSALLDAVTAEDFATVAKALVKHAKEGDPRAIKELFDRTLGRPVEADLIERIEQLESAIEAGASR